MSEEYYGIMTLDVLGISWLRSSRDSRNSLDRVIKLRMLEINGYVNNVKKDRELCSYIIGDFGKLLLEDEIDIDAYFSGKEVEKQQSTLGSYTVEVPEEYRRYIKKSEIHKLPKGTRIYRGPRGGLYVDVREIGEEKLQEYGLKHYRRESESVEEHRYDILKDIDAYEKMVRKAGRDVKECASIFSYLHESMFDKPEVKRMEGLFKEIETGIKYLLDPWTSDEDVFEIAEKIKERMNRYSSLLVSLGEEMDEDEREFLKRYSKLLLVLRGYASTNYDVWSCIIEALDKRLSGNRRFGFIDTAASKIRDVKRLELVNEIAQEISDEEYELWREYCREMFRKYVLKGRKRVKLYRGLSRMEEMNVIANLILGRETKINGVIASFTVSREVAEKFGDFIAWVYEDGSRVVGGWWNASEYFDSKEKEITLVIDSGGMKLSGVDVSPNLKETMDMIISEGKILDELDAVEKIKMLYRTCGGLFKTFIDMLEYYLSYGRKLKDKTKIYDRDYSKIFDKMANTVKKMLEEMNVLIKQEWPSEGIWPIRRYIEDALFVARGYVTMFYGGKYRNMVEELPEDVKESVSKFEETVKYYVEKITKEVEGRE